MSIRDTMNAEIRLAILQILNQDAGYSINHRIMALALEQNRAFSLTDDQIKTHFRWLADQELVTVEEVDGLTIARLTDSGQSAATGRRKIPGVARPRPNA